MKSESPEIAAARSLAARTAEKLRASPAFKQLPAATQSALLRDLGTIQSVLDSKNDPSKSTVAAADPFALALETPEDFARLRAGGRAGAGTQTGSGDTTPSASVDGTPTSTSPGPKASATDTLARKAGALSDEIDFPAFVAGLIHGTFDAIIDSAIRQMEAFAELVSSIARNTQDFTRDNVSANQARDWLVQHYPRELAMDAQSGEPQVRVRKGGEGEQEPPSPEWLADFGFAGEELTDEFIEEQLVPAARQRVGDSRLQMLATMVLLGMNRIVVRDGSISARVRFRAAARDTAKVDYAVSQDPEGGASWGTRGSSTYVTHDTKISTVGVNVQADSDLKVELFGEVKINFASETLPLDRFVDQARLTLLQNHARPITSAITAAAPAVPANAPASTLPLAPAPTPNPAPVAGQPK